jgi:uncharacterized protein YecE (DUF72 family)
MAGTILVGTCNWSDHVGFYPAGIKPADRLAYYARFFPIVEVDSTFYHLPSERNFAKWADITPGDFAFNVKAYRALTLHDRDEQGKVVMPTAEIAGRFSGALAPLREAGKLRTVHFQFPPWFTATDHHRDYLGQVRAMFPDDLLSIEFRHQSWLAPVERERTFAALREQTMVYTIVDEPQGASNSVPPLIEVTNPALSVVRFHGRNQETWNKPGLKGSMERFNYRYTTDELRGWLPNVERVANEAETVHLLFNNNAGNYAVVNGLEMRDLLGQEHLPVEQAISQARLF